MSLEEVRKEIQLQVRDETPPAAVEAAARQLLIMRECADRVNKEGAVVIDAKGNASEHPAIQIERSAGRELRQWLLDYGKRR